MKKPNVAQRSDQIGAKAPHAPAWLIFLLTVQGQRSALRMRLWRSLKALGTAVLRDGVYLLPNKPELLDALRAIESGVASSDGSVQILELDARDALQQQEFEGLFDRTAEYQKLLKDLRELSKKLPKMKASALGQAADRLRRTLESIATVDFFPGDAAAQATLALDDLLASANAILSPHEPHPIKGRIPRLDIAEFQGRTWATRRRPWADRLSSAWLIHRFIDPQAPILWLNKPKDCPKDALGFDFDGATFTHIGSRVTFEVLTASFDLENDPALEQMGGLIHYLDVGGVPVPEAPGVEALMNGAREAFADDDTLLVEAEKLLDFLYASFKRQR